MKMIVLAVLALAAVAVAAPPVDEPVQIVRSEFEQQPEGGYNYNYEASNGIVRSETGELREVPDEENKPHKVVVVRGEYSYPGTNGEEGEKISYYADETGYHAEGPSIPKAEVPARR